MSLLFKIVYAAHANGTHHKLALDGLRGLECTDAEKWRRLFLKHAELYLEGSKAPDKEFKDFKNHVLHVHDNFWGGAPEKAESWYKLFVRALKDRNWSEAVWCAGVLTHYYTDPIHPFHTAQSEAESNIHRAVEWSISKSYDALRPLGLAAAPPEFHLGTDEHWLKDLVIAGAETSNRHYETLIARYDFHLGVVDPPAGLDDTCRGIIGGLTVYAATGVGKIIDRAISEAGVEAPDVKLTAETVLAGLKIPLKWLTKKIADASDRRQVEAMYDELQSTGRVEKTLAEDDRTVQELYDREVNPLRNSKAQRDRARRRESSPLPHGVLPPVASRMKGASQGASQPAAELGELPRTLDEMLASKAPAATQVAPAEAAQPVVAAEKAQPALTAPSASVPAIPLAEAASIENKDTPAATATKADRASRPPQYYLTPADDIEAAPSIGPKTAQRFYDIGMMTVADLLAADPEKTAEDLDVSHIKPASIADWQNQSQLVIDIPGLRGTHAQLLVGAGLRTSDEVATADAASAHSAILRFAMTSEGQRILRDGQPPDLEKINAWLANARQAHAA
ncbi:MAG TPA: DUF4332 domain-containing protein [Hyphomicrobiaceae bacterium]|nr:DUF4332 domain-containing protein [Hyphomicrobiaceae bacterium]